MRVCVCDMNTDVVKAYCMHARGVAIIHKFPKRPRLTASHDLLVVKRETSTGAVSACHPGSLLAVWW